MKPDDIRLLRIAEPDFHDTAGLSAPAAEAVGSPFRDEDLLIFFWPPDLISDRHFQAAVKDNPEFAPPKVKLKGNGRAGVHGDDLKASGSLMGEGAEFSPGAEVLNNFFPVLGF